MIQNGEMDGEGGRRAELSSLRMMMMMKRTLSHLGERVDMECVDLRSPIDSPRQNEPLCRGDGGGRMLSRAIR